MKRWPWPLVLTGVLSLGALAAALAGAARWAEGESSQAQRNELRLWSSRFDTLEAGLTRRLETWRTRAAALFADWPLTEATETLRARNRREGWIRQLFWRDAQGLWLFPPEKEALSLQEEGFLERARLFQDWLSPPSPQGADQGEARRPASPLTDAPWWLSYYYGEGEQLILWQPGPNAGQIGLELTSASLWADLAVWAPEALRLNGEESFRVYLRQPDRTVFALWGPREPEAPETPILRRNLPSPLANWAWELYLGPPDTTSAVLWVGSLGLSLGLLWLGGLVWLLQHLHRRWRLAEQRQSFVNQVSHELKTPLTNLRLYGELMARRWQDQGFSDTRIPEYLKVMDQETARLRRLVDNVLTFARQDPSGESRPGRPLDAAKIIQSLTQAFAPSLERQGLVLETIIEPGPLLHRDPDLLEQILGNLLSNAEKYAASGAWLGLAARRGRTSWTFWVEDRGPGIPAAQQQRVWQPFVRLHQRLTDAGGAGLGLSIARDLSRSLGATLILHSPAPRDGAWSGAPEAGPGCRFLLMLEDS